MAKHIEEIFDRGDKAILGIDDENNLYWNGHRIITEQKVSLDKKVNWAIIIASGATVLLTVFTVLELIIC